MKDISRQAAKVVVKGLNKILKVEANTTSSFVVYQPKAPADLKRFRGKK